MSDFFCRNKFTRVNAGALTKAKTDVKKALQTPENHPQFRTYLVGEQITLTDIAVASIPRVSVQHEFQTVVGDAPFIDVALTAEGDYFDKKAANKDAPKKVKAAPKEEAPQTQEGGASAGHAGRVKPSPMVLGA
ncbi:hypothetical protein PR002_g952 [Phytophthora rubi]|uniref:Glutathione S-transferase C-terminal domain-containing protein n=1 Tax=Phytophthora rubi TaxID=129364 RepID=A0A6A3P3C4_9STRA|nr:hypothetical protein PR002_g952 [Phytophthora rubi]